MLARKAGKNYAIHDTYRNRNSQISTLCVHLLQPRMHDISWASNVSDVVYGPVECSSTLLEVLLPAADAFVAVDDAVSPLCRVGPTNVQSDSNPAKTQATEVWRCFAAVRRPLALGPSEAAHYPVEKE